MSLTTREPCTKWLGPQRRLGEVDPYLRVAVQLHNIQPGATWDPLLAVELHTKRILLPLFDNIVYRYIGTNFVYRFHYRTYPHRDALGELEEAIELNVRYLPDSSPVFVFRPVWATSRWMVNALLDPVGNYGIEGTATLSWFKV